VTSTALSARQQVTSGAQVIDINMDEGMLDSGGAGALPHPIAAERCPRAGDVDSSSGR
jgi:hypothetical protein